MTLTANMVEIAASTVTVNAGTTTVTGPLIGSVSVQTPSVIGATYTPGAGNIW
jgi:phage baseplate assembly protein gpV